MTLINKELEAERVKELIRLEFKRYPWFKGAGVKVENNDVIVVVNVSKINNPIPDRISSVRIQAQYV
jgi:NurA-like 5'-3' nuclease